jgi:transcription elongation factor Elf1
MAQRQLNDQRSATQQAQSCEQAFRSAVAPILADGNAVLTTANQIAALNQQLVTATHDEQAAGIANNVDAYNAAVDRANAAKNSRNAQIDTLNGQLTTLQQAGNASPGCGT